jgi:fatty acid desaturase
MNPEIFGASRTGVHAYRIADIAVVDVAATLLVAYIASMWPKLPFWFVLVCLLLVGIFLHRYFGVKTKVDEVLSELPLPSFSLN